MADFKTLVNDLEKDPKAFADIYKRMDQDMHLINLQRYVMMDSQTEPRPVPDIVNVTLNLPAFMATNILTDIGSASEQVVVESRDPEFDTHFVEDFIGACTDAANERNKKLGWLSLNEFTDGQLAIRGRAARRVLFRNVEGKLVKDISNWDTRHVTYELGHDGLQWAALHMKKSKDLVAAQYGVLIAAQETDVLDVWTPTHNEIWVDGNKIIEQEHSYGFTPVIIEIVSLGSGGYLLDEHNKAAEGESIFFMIRTIVPELNRLASIMQTLNLKAVKPPMQYESKEGGRATAPDYPEMGDVISTDISGGVKPINYGDAQRSAAIAQRTLMEAFEGGGITASELGLLGQPAASGVALLIAGEGRDRIFHPRLVSKGNLNVATARMGIKQTKQAFGGATIPIGTEGYEADFNLSKLDGEYKIHYSYSIRSQQVEAGRASLAASFGNLIPDHSKRVDILHRDDPEGDERLLRAERAERTSPSISKFQEIKALTELGRDFEAELLATELNLDVDRLLAGEVPDRPPVQPEQDPKQVLSLFGGGVGRVPGGSEDRAEEEAV